MLTCVYTMFNKLYQAKSQHLSKASSGSIPAHFHSRVTSTLHRWWTLIIIVCLYCTSKWLQNVQHTHARTHKKTWTDIPSKLVTLIIHNLTTRGITLSNTLTIFFVTSFQSAYTTSVTCCSFLYLTIHTPIFTHILLIWYMNEFKYKYNDKPTYETDWLTWKRSVLPCSTLNRYCFSSSVP